MKKITFLIALSIFMEIQIFSQDIIILKTGDEIKSKVLEIRQSEIVYKKFDNLNGPSYSTAKSDVFMVRYENGTKDVIYVIENKSTTQVKKEDREYSPTSSGHFILNPSSNISFNNITNTNSNFKYNVFDFSFTGGYFILDNFMSALSIGYEYLTFEDEFNFNNRSSISYGFQIRYYFLDKIFCGIGLIGEKSEDAGSNNYLGLEAGYAAFLNKHISIEPSLNYARGIGKTSATENIFGVTIGLGIYF